MRLASVFLVVLTVSASADPPKGRVVRVERPRGLGIPRLCKLSSMTKGVCAGAAKIGDRIVIVDKSQFAIVGEFRIDQVNPSPMIGRCDSDGPRVHEVVGKVVSGTFDVSGEIEGFRNLAVGPSSRIVKNQALPAGGRGDVVLALDADDNGDTDLVMTKYPCDERGAKDLHGKRLCFDTFRDRGGRLELADQVNICN